MVITLLQHIAKMSTAAKLLSPFSRTYRRLTVALMLQCCGCLSSSVCDVRIVAKRCVLEQKLLLTAYRKSYMRNRLVPKLITLHLCLGVKSRSCQPLRCIQRSLSQKPLEIEAWFQRTTNRKWHMWYQMVMSRMTSRDTERSNS